MFISDLHKCVFVFNESTGSRAVAKWFSEEYAGEEKTWKHSHFLCVVEKKYGKEYSERIKDYIVCLTVRNPFYRMRSMWARLKTYNNPYDGYKVVWDTFPEFCDYLLEISKFKYTTDNRNVCPQGGPFQLIHHEKWDHLFFTPIRQSEIYYDLLYDFGHVDYIIHQETNTIDLEKLPFVDKPVVLDTIGKGVMNRKVTESKELYRKIMQYCPEDFKLFGYNYIF